MEVRLVEAQRARHGYELVRSEAAIASIAIEQAGLGSR
jgi:hypothetical protein